MNPDFVEAVKSGAYKKISVSLYGPESPNNPLPGHYYLRHVGFLGAQPPAIKGLQAVEFAENEQTLDFETDFSERDLAYNDKALARVLRNLKNFSSTNSARKRPTGLFPSTILKVFQARPSRF